MNETPIIGQAIEGDPVDRSKEIPLTSPVYHTESADAIRQIEGILTDKPHDVIVFPLHAAYANSVSGQEFINLIRTRQSHYDTQGYPAVVAPLVDGDRSAISLLLSEVSNQRLSEPFQGELHRVDTIDTIQFILKHGFYQLPGRISFNQSSGNPIRDLENSSLLKRGNCAVLAFQILPEDKVCGAGALQFDPDNAMQTSLPPELLDLVSKASIMTKRELAWRQDPKILANQVLRLGSMTHTLQHLQKERINIPRTLEINRKLYKEGLITREVFSAIEEMIQ